MVVVGVMLTRLFRDRFATSRAGHQHISTNNKLADAYFHAVDHLA